MKQILFLAAGLFSLSSFAATTEGNDTTFLYKERKIIIRDSAEVTSISVLKIKGDDCKMFYEARYSDEGKKKATWHLSTSLDFPFSDLILKKNKNKKNKVTHRFDTHWSGLGFGFCNATQTGRGGLNGTEGVAPNFASSYEIFWNIFSVHIPINRRSLGLVSGFGIDWRNYRMDGNYRFVKNGPNLSIEGYPEGAIVDYSRLKTFDLTIPLLLEWQSPRTRGKLFFSAGPVLGIKTYSSVKTEYDLNGGHHKEFHEGVHQNPINVDLMAQIGYNHIGFYVKYSLFPVLQTRYSPDMRSLSTGIMWLF